MDDDIESLLKNSADRHTVDISTPEKIAQARINLSERYRHDKIDVVTDPQIIELIDKTAQEMGMSVSPLIYGIEPRENEGGKAAPNAIAEHRPLAILLDNRWLKFIKHPVLENTVEQIIRHEIGHMTNTKHEAVHEELVFSLPEIYREDRATRFLQASSALTNPVVFAKINAVFQPVTEGNISLNEMERESKALDEYCSDVSYGIVKGDLSFAARFTPDYPMIKASLESDNTDKIIDLAKKEFRREPNKGCFGGRQGYHPSFLERLQFVSEVAHKSGFDTSQIPTPEQAESWADKIIEREAAGIKAAVDECLKK